MERIIIIGCCGCGKTTLSRALSDKLRLPLVHLDTLYWRDHWQSVKKDEFDEQLLRELVKPRWIMDGNFNRTIPTRLAYCDTAIYMDYPRLLCLFGVMERVLKNYGRSRPDMGGYCPERFDLSFLKSVWNFNKANKKRYYEMLSNSDAKVILLRNRRQARAFLKGL